MTESTSTQKAAIDCVVDTFFAAFNNRCKNRVQLEKLTGIFAPRCVIVKTCASVPTIYDLDDFIAPRQQLLNGGGLEEFAEQEVWERTYIFGCLAQRLSAYKKSGILNGEKFDVSGMKSFHFAKSGNCWKITSVIWDDARDGAVVPSHAAMFSPA